jgi:prepilin-type processing-associated H-X9-DG protein
MRNWLIVFLLLAACSNSGTGDGTENLSGLSNSHCKTQYFEGDRFTICSAEDSAIEIATSDSSGAPYRRFWKLEEDLGDRAGDVAFAMNAGMFDDEGHAIGLLIEDGEEIRPINRREGGGNFHMKPNGVFLVRKDGTAEVVTSERYEDLGDISFASQSGPMLVIDGDIHPRFEQDGRSRNIRNGVGIGPGDTAIFAISEVPVSFGRFARLFRDELKSGNALYFDGSVSSLWDPANARRDIGAPLGPMVVVFRSPEPSQ